MIRIEHKSDGDHVQTKWIKETADGSSLIGRLMLTREEFEILRKKLERSDEVDGRHSSHFFVEKT